MKALLKQVSLLLLFTSFCLFTEGQILRTIKQKAKERLKAKANEKIDNTIDKGVTKASEKFDTTVNKIIKGKDNSSAGPSQLVTQGKFVTTGIKFEEGSDQVKGESFLLLKDVADILKQNPEMRIKIVCHTDTDGDAETNLNLTKLRATSIKNQLVMIFGIDETRLEYDGEGGNNPISKNKSEEGKAMNRRVEFIRT